MMNIDGRCHCGAITYTAAVDPEQVAICHCTDCQMLTGTAYRVVVPAAARGFKLLTGKPRHYIKTAESGARWVQAFCENCGSSIYGCTESNPAAYNLRLGVIRQRAQFTPRRQIWWRSALPWVMNLEGVPKSDEGR